MSTSLLACSSILQRGISFRPDYRLTLTTKYWNDYSSIYYFPSIAVLLLIVSCHSILFYCGDSHRCHSYLFLNHSYLLNQPNISLFQPLPSPPPRVGSFFSFSIPNKKIPQWPLSLLITYHLLPITLFLTSPLSHIPWNTNGLHSPFHLVVPCVIPSSLGIPCLVARHSFFI